MEITLRQRIAARREPKNRIRLFKLVDRLQHWAERHRQRRALLELDQHMLKDIGISRCDAEQEAGKWFFQE